MFFVLSKTIGFLLLPTNFLIGVGFVGAILLLSRFASLGRKLVMAAVLLYALYRITGHRTKGDIYFTHFPNVTGIKQGTVVAYEGFAQRT